jgi:hypothetical protein
MIGFHSNVRLAPSSINSAPSRTRVKSLSHKAFVLTMVKSCWLSCNQMQLAIVCMSAYLVTHAWCCVHECIASHSYVVCYMSA